MIKNRTLSLLLAASLFLSLAACAKAPEQGSPEIGNGGESVPTQMQHAARVKVDEYGCEVAAFTVITMRSSAV